MVLLHHAGPDFLSPHEIVYQRHSSFRSCYGNGLHVKTTKHKFFLFLSSIILEPFTHGSINNLTCMLSCVYKRPKAVNSITLERNSSGSFYQLKVKYPVFPHKFPLFGQWELADTPSLSFSTMVQHWPLIRC